jgi:hypothetical protein
MLIIPFEIIVLREYAYLYVATSMIGNYATRTEMRMVRPPDGPVSSTYGTWLVQL